MGKQAAIQQVMMQSEAVDGPLARPESGSTAWIDNLTPEEKAVHEQRMEVNKKKALKSQTEALTQNKHRQYEELMRMKAERIRLLQEKKEEAQLAMVVAKAKEEGVVEASLQDSEGTWWAKVGPDKWQVAKQDYLCTACDKHLNKWTLETHLRSEGHSKKFLASPPLPPPPTPLSQTGAPSPEVTTPCSSPPPCGAATSNGLPIWQNVVDGVLRCIPCTKQIDDWHLASSTHDSRLTYWLEQWHLEKSGWPAPPEPYYAWVPAKDGQGRVRMCLLCKKSGSIGTEGYDTAEHALAKLHSSRLLAYSDYAAGICQIKEKYHPKLCAGTPASPTTIFLDPPAAEPSSQTDMVPPPPPPPPPTLAEWMTTSPSPASVKKSANKIHKTIQVEQSSYKNAGV